MRVGLAISKQMAEAEVPQTSSADQHAWLILVSVLLGLILICLVILLIILGKAFHSSSLETDFEYFDRCCTFTQNQPNKNMSLTVRGKRISITVKKENGVISDARMICGKKRGGYGD